MKSYLTVTYRDIAKMLVAPLPVEGMEFGAQVGRVLKDIKHLTAAEKLALKTAYVWSRKAPKEEREDLYQELVLNLLKAGTTEDKLAYAIARCDWRNWWSRYRIRQHTSLDSVVEDTEGNAVTLAELLVGEVEFERLVEGKIEAERLWSRLPDDIKPIVLKRLEGKPVSSGKRGRPKSDGALDTTERQRLNRWIKRDGYKLLLEV